MGLMTNLICEALGAGALCMAVAFNTQGLNGLAGGGSVFAPIGIAVTLMSMIYAMGRVSGGHYNPAVTTALTVAGKHELMDWAPYVIAQIVGGTLMVLLFNVISDRDVMVVSSLAPAAGHSKMQALMAELVYTIQLPMTVCFSAAMASASGKQYYGLAIGFCVVCGAYAVGGISGGCFNPAISMSIGMNDLMLGDATPSTGSDSLTNALLYSAVELGGGVVAGLMFKFLNDDDGEISLVQKCVCEAIGTFFLVHTVTASVASGSAGAAFAIGSQLMVNVFNFGNLSGGHHNPCVSLGCFGVGRGVMEMVQFGAYVVAQLVAACGAGIVATMIMSADGDVDHASGKIMWAYDKTDGTAPTVWQTGFAEMWYTFQLVFVVVSTTTKMSDPGWTSDYVGLVVGFTLMSGTHAAGNVSGGALNPAVRLGSIISHVIFGGTDGFQMEGIALYWGAEVLGAILAIGAFRLIWSEEYDGSAVEAADSAQSGDSAGSSDSE